MRRIALMVAQIVALSSAMTAGSTAADSWRTLSGSEIAVALTGRTLVYESGAWQDFRQSGKTLYNAGRDSWGNWGVQDDAYCSQWPPGEDWICYRMETDGEAIRFVGSGGEMTVGRYQD